MAKLVSSKPRKQRKARAQAPMHMRRKMMHMHVAKSLRAKLGTNRRAMLVKKGDKIRVISGSMRKKEGKVMEVDYHNLSIFVEGIARKNAKGIEKLARLQPSNAEIIDGDFNSADRKAMLGRSSGTGAKK